jgi:hypothetical protein
MTSSGVARREAAWRLVYLSLAVILSALVFGIFVYRPGINGYDRAMFADMVYGRAAKPFVYRTLLPTAVRVLASAIPAEARSRLNAWASQSPAIDNMFTILGWEREQLTEYFIALVLMYLCLWGFVRALGYLLDGVYEASERVRDVCVLVALLGLTQFFRYYSYLYDLPTLFLFTLGLGLMVRERWCPFLLVDALGCLNKETTILLTLVFAIRYYDRARLRRRAFWQLLLAQLAIFAASRAVLTAVFWNNPGSLFQVLFPRHNLDVLGAYPLAAVFGWCGVALLLAYKWRGKPRFLRQALWIVVPLVVLTFFFGYLDELRDYYEAYPIVLLLALHSIGKIAEFKVVTLPERADAPTG